MWIVQAKSAIGPLCIGASIAQISGLVGQRTATFRRAPDSRYDIHAYDEDLVHLACSSDGVIRGISVFRPKDVTYRGVNLLGRKAAEVVSDLRQVGVDTKATEVGYWVEAAGVMLVEVNGLVDGVELGSE